MLKIFLYYIKESIWIRQPVILKRRLWLRIIASLVSDFYIFNPSESSYLRIPGLCRGSNSRIIRDTLNYDPMEHQQQQLSAINKSNTDVLSYCIKNMSKRDMRRFCKFIRAHYSDGYKPPDKLFLSTFNDNDLLSFCYIPFHSTQKLIGTVFSRQINVYLMDHHGWEVWEKQMWYTEHLCIHPLMRKRKNAALLMEMHEWNQHMNPEEVVEGNVFRRIYDSSFIVEPLCKFDTMRHYTRDMQPIIINNLYTEFERDAQKATDLIYDQIEKCDNNKSFIFMTKEQLVRAIQRRIINVGIAYYKTKDDSTKIIGIFIFRNTGRYNINNTYIYNCIASFRMDCSTICDGLFYGAAFIPLALKLNKNRNNFIEIDMLGDNTLMRDWIDEDFYTSALYMHNIKHITYDSHNMTVIL